MKGSDCAFFLALFGVSAKISGTISLYRHFLDNGSWDVVEICPGASLDISAPFPVTFSDIKKFPFLLAGFACPQLYQSPRL